MIHKGMAKRRLGEIFGREHGHYQRKQALGSAEDSGMRIVQATPDARLLLIDPHSATHYEFKPTGPLGEYTTRLKVDVIVTGKPVPDEYLNPPRSEWEPLDADWRYLVENGDVRDHADSLGVGSR